MLLAGGGGDGTTRLWDVATGRQLQSWDPLQPYGYQFPVFGQLSYDKGMLVLAATQAENVDWGTLELGDRSLLTYALTRPQTAGQPFDLRQWLSQAEKQVPELYKNFVKSEQQPYTPGNMQEQEPALFDFSKKHSAGSSHQ